MTKMTSSLLKWLRLPLILVGLILLFVAERYLSSESYLLYVRLVGYALSALALVATGLLYARSGAAERRSLACSLSWQITVLAGAAVYLLYRKTLGDAVEPSTFVAKVALASWLSLVILGIAAGIGCEWALRDSGTGMHAEPWRVRRSAMGWFGLGLLLIGLVGINFAANKKDKTSDWSYLKTTAPSESSRQMLKTLSHDMTVALFYPRTNEVLPALQEYFQALAAHEPRLKVVVYDKDMQPTQAETYRVSRNGQIVFDQDGKRSRIDTGLELTQARKTLRQLDSEFQKSFLEVTAGKKIVYFTRGHGEFSWVGNEAEDPLKSLQLLEGFLKQQNYELRLLGIAEGSATAVPEEASVVIVVGPTLPFQAEEIAALKAYMERGGNLMAFMDLDKPHDQTLIGGSEQPLWSLLAEIGIQYKPQVLANDRNFVTATRSDADKWFLFTNIYTAHDSVVSLSRHDERIATLTFQAGSLQVTPEVNGWKAFETMRALSDTFQDLNRNFVFDEKQEKRDSYVIAAAAEKRLTIPNANKPSPAKSGAASDQTSAKKLDDKKTQEKIARVVAFADANLLSDALVRNPGNALFFADSLKWLVGETQLAGAPTTEEDIRIRHTRKEDVIWFHGTVIAVPLLVILAGFFATRRKRIARVSTKAAVMGGQA